MLDFPLSGIFTQFDFPFSLPKTRALNKDERMTLRTIVLYPTLVFMVISSYSTFTLADEKETATNLTTLLRSARSVTVNKATIADPSQFDVSKFIKKTKKTTSAQRVKK